MAAAGCECDIEPGPTDPMLGIGRGGGWLVGRQWGALDTEACRALWPRRAARCCGLGAVLLVALLAASAVATARGAARRKAGLASLEVKEEISDAVEARSAYVLAGATKIQPPGTKWLESDPSWPTIAPTQPHVDASAYAGLVPTPTSAAPGSRDQSENLGVYPTAPPAQGAAGANTAGYIRASPATAGVQEAVGNPAYASVAPTTGYANAWAPAGGSAYTSAAPTTAYAGAMTPLLPAYATATANSFPQGEGEWMYWRTTTTVPGSLATAVTSAPWLLDTTQVTTAMQVSTIMATVATTKAQVVPATTAMATTRTTFLTSMVAATSTMRVTKTAARPGHPGTTAPPFYVLWKHSLAHAPATSRVPQERRSRLSGSRTTSSAKARPFFVHAPARTALVVSTTKTIIITTTTSRSTSVTTTKTTTPTSTATPTKTRTHTTRTSTATTMTITVTRTTATRTTATSTATDTETATSTKTTVTKATTRTTTPTATDTETATSTATTTTSTRTTTSRTITTTRTTLTSTKTTTKTTTRTTSTLTHTTTTATTTVTTTRTTTTTSLTSTTSTVTTVTSTTTPRPCGLIEPNTDYPGNDIGSAKGVPSPELCCQKCAADSRCLAWTWAADQDGSSGACYFKGGHPRRELTKVFNRGLTSGQPTQVKRSILVVKRRPGQSLYCFSLMLPWGYESSLLRLQYQEGASIFGCDGYTVFSNQEMELEPGFHTFYVDSDLKCQLGGEFGTAMNTGIFLKVWETVIRAGQFQFHDWTVKVDPDAVFFPERLRVELIHHSEVGNGIYLNNCKYGLHGPLEVYSRNAVRAFASGMQRCQDHFNQQCSGPCQWGEDMYIDQCLWKVLNVKREDEYNLLREDHCDPPQGWESCKEAQFTTFHPFKSAEGYRTCLHNARGAALA